MVNSNVKSRNICLIRGQSIANDCLWLSNKLAITCLAKTAMTNEWASWWRTTLSSTGCSPKCFSSTRMGCSTRWRTTQTNPRHCQLPPLSKWGSLTTRVNRVWDWFPRKKKKATIVTFRARATRPADSWRPTTLISWLNAGGWCCKTCVQTSPSLRCTTVKVKSSIWRWWTAVSRAAIRYSACSN